MMSHVVLMAPRPDLSDEERDAFMAAFERAIHGIPSVRGVRIGTRVKIGAQYEAAMPETGEYLAVIDFDDREGLDAYLRHPEHEALGRLFYQTLSSALVYDFEVGGVERLYRR